MDEPTVKTRPMAMKPFTQRSTGNAQIPMAVTPKERMKEIQDWTDQAAEWAAGRFAV
jgi:hypothetical protein